MNSTRHECPAWEEPLRRYVAGTVPADEKQDLLLHLARCEACRYDLAWLNRLHGAFARVLKGDSEQEPAWDVLFRQVVDDGPEGQAGESPWNTSLPEGSTVLLRHVQRLREFLDPAAMVRRLRAHLDVRQGSLVLQVGPIEVPIL